MDKNLLTKIKADIELNGIIAMKVVGASMEPLIRADSKIVVRKITNLTQVKKFDIIVFKQEDKFLCHYFWKHNQHFNQSLDNPTIVTRPLNPIVGYDHPISYNEIVGKVVNFKIPIMLKVAIYLRTALKNYLGKD